MNSLKLDSNLTVENMATKVLLDREPIIDAFSKIEIGNEQIITALCDYIETGENEAILSQVIPQKRGRIFRLHGINIFPFFYNQWQPLGFIRLGKVTAAAMPLIGPPPYLWANSPNYGSDFSPDWWRYSVTYLLSKKTNHYGSEEPQIIGETGKQLLEMAAIENIRTPTIFDVLMFNDNSFQDDTHIGKFDGIETWFKNKKPEIVALVAPFIGKKLILFCATIDQVGAANNYMDFLIETTMHNIKAVRQKALMTLTTANMDLLKEKISTLYPIQRAQHQLYLIDATVALFNKQATPILSSWLNHKLTRKIKDTIEQHISFLTTSAGKSEKLSDNLSSYTAIDGSIVRVPPYDFAKEEIHFSLNPLEEVSFQQLRQAIENYNIYLKKQKANPALHWPAKTPFIDPQTAIEIFKLYLSGKENEPGTITPIFEFSYNRGYDSSAAYAFLSNPKFSFYQLLSLHKKMVRLHGLNLFFDPYLPFIAKPVLIKRMNEEGDWRIFNRIRIKHDEKPVIEELLVTAETYDPISYDFINPQAFWPLIADSFDILDLAFGISQEKPNASEEPRKNQRYDLSTALWLLQLLPKTPMRYAAPLMLIATGNTINGQKVNYQQKAIARNLLATMADIDPAIALLLQDGQQNLRKTAADWLKNRKAISLIPALQTALKKEKNDTVRGALLSALQHLGDDISSHFVAEKLLSDAKKGLEKAKGKELDWFPFSQLPQVTWKNGNAVDPLIIRWLLILAAKLKQPQGNPMATLWLDQFTKESAHTFGVFIVEAWIKQDTLAIDSDEANAYATLHIDKQLAINKKNAGPNPVHAQYYTTDRDLLFEELRHEILGKYKQSAIDNKGILALATLIDGATIAAIGSSYIKKHGKRASQAKAIIDMLAENPALAAIQAILAAATRTKQKTVQDHARQAINDIAEHYGWTLDELADRTIPTAGLDDNGEAELVCGKGRIFKLQLNEQGNLIIFNDKGSQVKSLLTANSNNGIESQEIEEAKKFVANAQKEIKQVITLQTERLFEAMCLGRVWSVEEWQSYILNHPVMRQIICRLIWIGIDDNGKPALTFRPMEDGSFTDGNDNAVDLNKVLTIKLAHISLLTNEEGKAWRNHIKDYALTPPFMQLREDLPTITEDIKQQFEVADRNGFMIESNTLRNTANKLGYQRGDVVDSGYFTNYIRRYASLNLVASINFTGNVLPEENISTALTSLCFYKMKNNKYSANMEIALEEVPPVLLAEAYADYHAMAAAGTGFDKGIKMSLFRKILNKFSKKPKETTLDGQTSETIIVKRKPFETLLDGLGMKNKDLIKDLYIYVETGQNQAILLKAAQINDNFYWYDTGLMLYLPQIFDYNWQPLGYLRMAKIIQNLIRHPLYSSHVYGSNASPVEWRCLVTCAILSSKDRNAPPSGGSLKGYKIEWQQFEQLANLYNASMAEIFDLLTTDHPAMSFWQQIRNPDDLKQWFIDNKPEIVAFSKVLKGESLTHFCKLILALKLCDGYLDELLQISMSSSKAARSAAIATISAVDKNVFQEKIVAIYPDQSPTNRALLALTTVTILERAALPILLNWQSIETAAKPKETIKQQLSFLGSDGTETDNEVISDNRLTYAALDGSVITFPPCAFDDEQKQSELGDIDEIFYTNFANAIDNYNQHLAQLKAIRKQNGGTWHSYDGKQLDQKLMLTQLRNVMNGEIEKAKNLNKVFFILWKKDIDLSGISQFVTNPQLSLYQLLALLLCSTDHALYYLCHSHEHSIFRQAIINKIKQVGDLRAFERIWVNKLKQPSFLQRLLSNTYYNNDEFDFLKDCTEQISKDSVSYFIADGFDLFDEIFGLKPSQNKDHYDVYKAFLLLEMLPKIPKRYAMALMMIATGGALFSASINKNTRILGRNLLESMPHINPAIAKLLQDGQQNTRVEAAQWLVIRKAKDELPALKTALKKEKSDVARAAMISALGQLGGDVSEYLAPDRLLSDAQKGLEKNKVKGIDWFPFDQLPQAEWKDGSAVDPIILQWWIVLAAKLKEPQGNAMLSLWLDQLAPESADTFGIFVAKTWVAHDTFAVGSDEANAYASALIDQELQSNQQMVKNYPQYADYFTTDRDLLFQELRRHVLGNYKQSAIDAKGILALAARGNGAEIAAIGSQFIKKHGKRVSQAKAIIDMLAANPSPAAIQIVLASANRTKQKTVQEYARNAIYAIAAKYGWSLEELAERTVPTAGLDENGCAELECGRGRIYKLQLNSSGNLIVLNDKDKEVKALPTANPNDDEEKAEIAASKKFVTNAKKELKQVVTLQTERLFEGMCLGRLWPKTDWQDFLLNHPIMRQIISSLVWIGLDKDGNKIQTFRPLEDGSLTDSNDEEISLDAIHIIKLAHITLLSEDETKAWRTHLADYEVKPAFMQFRENPFILTEDMKNLTQINDRQGWMIETFKLRSLTSKYGYERGQAEDAGWFTTYTRRFANAKLVAVIEFTGNCFPETSRPAALLNISFSKYSSNGSYWGQGMTLGKIPPVLLTETMADYYAIAAAGTGFNEDWEKLAYL